MNLILKAERDLKSKLHYLIKILDREEVYFRGVSLRAAFHDYLYRCIAARWGIF